MIRLGVYAAALFAVAGAITAFVLTSAKPSSASSTARHSCPRHVYLRTSRGPDRTIEDVVEAARRQIPAAYRDAWVNQNGVVKLTPATYDVTAVFAVASHTRYFREAAQACGSRVATASWVVRFYVPESESAMYAAGTAFLARTRSRRWRLWDAR